MIPLVYTIVALTLLVSMPATSSHFSGAPSLERATTLGRVEGVRDETLRVDAWLGIPYAAPPIGSRRWMGPAPHEPWSGVRRTHTFGAPCPQLGGMQGPGWEGDPTGRGVVTAFGQVSGSEDCLTLNIWRPTADTRQLPVIVFIHGGANVAGYTGDPLYHGGRLAARANAVVVTLNYRLGVLGWFPSPALDPAAGNAGLLDVVSAIRFVRANAAAFGGDAGNITLIGQSAGAVNALAITTMQPGDALFQRVYSMSGALVSMSTEARQPYVDRVTDRLLVAEGVAGDVDQAARIRRERGNAWLGTWLLARPVDALLRAADGVPGGGIPTADGSILPLDPAAAVRGGRYLRVPMLFSRTSEEGKFFATDVYRVKDAERLRMVFGVAKDGAAGTSGLGSILRQDLTTGAAFEAAVERLGKVEEHFMNMTVEHFAAGGADHSSVVFDWKGQREPWRTLVGSTHGVDLPFLFGYFGPSIYAGSHHAGPRAEVEALSEQFVAALAAWARGGAFPESGLWRRPTK